ncbi:MAG: radical SAM protein [Verrucomicrobia bacterium]|nr:radical SAM protein [Verrucomicrobiota bacterium]
MKYRYESFGGIVASEDPPFLAFVDRDYLRGCGVEESEEWARESHHVLTAPTEVHISRTNRCSANCEHCYMDSGKALDGEMSTDEFKVALKTLADMGVFHVALGGGEAMENDDLIEVATYAREVELVPNLTTGGHLVTADNVDSLKVFGQVNLSLDSISPSPFRSKTRLDQTTKVFDLLTRSGIRTGINAVLGKTNFDEIDALCEYAKQHGLSEIEFLRLKPVGRAKGLYQQERMTHEQAKTLLPKLQNAREKYGVTLKIDCSLVPMLCYTKPEKEVLKMLALHGCEAGNILAGITSDGYVSGCSFLPPGKTEVKNLEKDWDQLFPQYRSWNDGAMEPCRSCHYLEICKGGCHAVAEAVTGSMNNPDPDCPFVVDFENNLHPVNKD